MLSLNHRRQLRQLLILTLALAGTVSGLALPGFSRVQFPSYQATPLTLNPSWTLTGDLNTARNYHSATLLPNGKLLVVGGYNSRAILNSAELYDPATGTWSVTGRLNVPRAFSSATLLPNGKVLVAGGYDSDAPVPTNTAEFYDPVTGTWSLTGNLNTTRSWHSATLLQNGKVLIAGGWGGSGLLNSAELFDPDTGTWSVTGRLLNTGGSGRFAHTAMLLPTGKVLVAGGGGEDDYSHVFFSAELYDPPTGTWSITNSLNTNRNNQTATLLPTGLVLMAGGGGFPCSGGFCYSTVNNTAELYNPATGTWSYTGSHSRRSLHTATLLPNGQVIVAGGADYGYDINRFIPLDSAELYDPLTGAWSNTARLNTSRFSHTATLLKNGRVVVAGGFNNTSGTLNSAELYDPATSSNTNPIDDAQFFVRQHYLDFLNREPNQDGFDYWTNEINKCGPDLLCINRRRVGVSAAFFVEQEFNRTGGYIYRTFKTALGRPPSYSEFMQDRLMITEGETLDATKAAYAAAFIRRAEFLQLCPVGTSAEQFIDDLLNRVRQVSNLDLSSQRGALIAMSSNDAGRATALRTVADDAAVVQAEKNSSFVRMQYFGYLRRDPDPGGEAFWFDVVTNREVNNYLGMVCAFITSREYQERFSTAVTRSNADCANLRP